MPDDSKTFRVEPDFEIRLTLPKILFRSIRTRPDAHWLRQVAIATERRYFYLTEDWHIELEASRYPFLTGKIVIPVETAGKRFEFDGASIPVPWLVSLLTVGVLRPLGVLLVASIVHDYAFRYGELLIQKAGETEPAKVPVARHDADALFRDIITAVNGNRTVGRLGWYFVRLGYWLGVPYNGLPRTGVRPTLVGLSFLIFMALLVSAVVAFSWLPVVLVALGLYLLIYGLTLFELSRT
ncbi:MAG: DUF1353 domain-containing protein [Pseudomonadota bacterium]